MELEGFKRMLTSLEMSNLTVGKIVTDRHCQLKKYIREERPNVLHMFDVWHVAKGNFSSVDEQVSLHICMQ